MRSNKNTKYYQSGISTNLAIIITVFVCIVIVAIWHGWHKSGGTDISQQDSSTITKLVTDKCQQSGNLTASNVEILHYKSDFAVVTLICGSAAGGGAPSRQYLKRDNGTWA